MKIIFSVPSDDLMATAGAKPPASAITGAKLKQPQK